MVKVFFVEPTGYYDVRLTFWCDSCNCGTHHMLCRNPNQSFENLPEGPSELACSKCAGTTRLLGRGNIVVYRRTDTGEEISSISNYPGACYAVDKIYDRRSKSYRTGRDGRCLEVVTPNGGIWSIDSRASNCTLPDDNEHRCWCRSGSPETGDLSVHKLGSTCAAGAGSIILGDYHGFLRESEFIPC